MNQWWWVYWRIYASLGLNELNVKRCHQIISCAYRTIISQHHLYRKQICEINLIEFAQRAQDAITWFWRQNDVVTSFWRHINVVIASRVRWVVVKQTRYSGILHHSDVIMSAKASQISGVSIFWSAVCSGEDQRKTSKLRVTVLCEWNPPVTRGFPSQRASNAENVSIWWRHRELNLATAAVLFSYLSIELCWTPDTKHRDSEL